MKPRAGTVVERKGADAVTNVDRGLVSNIGPVQIDWPRTVGYYGGIAAAVGFGMLEPPIGIFIAAIPFVKMLNRPNSAFPLRLVAQTLDGAAKPVGGDSDAIITVVRSDTTPGASSGGGGFTARVAEEARSIWSEARSLAGVERPLLGNHQ
jgi:hypothetical protein